MARVAIGRLVEKESVTVRVNPGDLERMREHRDELLSNGEIKNFRVIEDQRVDRGGVVVETDGGTIDARISTQVNEARRVLHIEDEVVVTPAANGESSLRAARAS
jgi:flagellar assembly protein FliH